MFVQEEKPGFSCLLEGTKSVNKIVNHPYCFCEYENHRREQKLSIENIIKELYIQEDVKRKYINMRCVT